MLLRGQVDPGPQMLGHQPFEGAAFDLLGTVERTGGPQGAEDAGVEEVELRPGRDPAGGAAAEDGQTEGEEQVLQDLHVALGGLASHGAVAGQVGDVQQTAVGEGDRLEETRELADVAHQSFGLDLLTKVEGGIGSQRVRTLGGAPHEGQHALAKGALEVEAAAQLGRHEGRHDAPRRPAAEQVDAGPADLAGAGAGEGEERAPGVDEGVDDIEQLRRLLHLVDDDGPSLGGQDEVSQALGAGQEVSMDVGLEQIHPERFREPLAEPGRLAGAAGAEEKEAALRRTEESLYDLHFRSKFGGFASKLRPEGFRGKPAGQPDGPGHRPAAPLPPEQP